MYAPARYFLFDSVILQLCPEKASPNQVQYKQFLIVIHRSGSFFFVILAQVLGKRCYFVECTTNSIAWLHILFVQLFFNTSFRQTGITSHYKEKQLALVIVILDG